MSNPSSRSLPTVTLVIPVLNEIVGLKVMLPRVPRDMVDQIIVLDGGSTDGSVEYALSNGCEVHRQVRRGLRMAYLEVLEKVRGDVMINFSPDGNSLPEIIPDLVKEMHKGYDMVIVSRYLEHAESEDDTPLSRAGNLVLRWVINLLFGSKYTDALVIFRAYRSSLPRELGVTRVRSDRYEKWIGRWISLEPQLSVRAAKFKKKVGEIPGDEPRRIEDKEDVRKLLPPTRINHFKSGFACLYMILEDFLTPGSRMR